MSDKLSSGCAAVGLEFSDDESTGWTKEANIPQTAQESALECSSNKLAHVETMEKMEMQLNWWVRGRGMSESNIREDLPPTQVPKCVSESLANPAFSGEHPE